MQVEQQDKRTGERSKRRVSDLQSWLEAWNVYLAIKVHSAPDLALELVKYQTSICHLFNAYSVSACLQYDKLFRHTAERDPTLQWDTLKEDLLLWCMTRNQQPFRKPNILSRLGPPPASTSGTGS